MLAPSASLVKCKLSRVYSLRHFNFFYKEYIDADRG
nr:MAG TPA: hypothetical protein [Caudoviricetes sp.]